MDKKKLGVFSGSANQDLTQRICENLDIPLGEIIIRNFADGEIYCQIGENVRGRDVFLVQPTCKPVNNNLTELLLMIDAFRRASAKRVTAVIPYFGYARQDRKDRPRVPISSKLVSNLLQAAGADRVLTMDLHAPQIQGFFDIPVDHLFATPILLDYIRSLELSDIVVVSPDAGGVERARFLSKKLHASLAIIDKRRSGPNIAEVVNVIGDVKGKNAVIIDDMIDTAGTLTKVAEVIMDLGAISVIAGAAHPVLSGPSIERIQNSMLGKVIITDTIPLEKEARDCKKIIQLSVAELMSKAIKSIHEETSVSSLFV
jgi:ribose-phosphate pyrophosphokinase